MSFSSHLRLGLRKLTARNDQILLELARLREQVGDLQLRAISNLAPDRFREAGFGVHSQFDEDGLIQFLIGHVPIENEVFVEFGVADYSESNTRFLLTHNNWRGLILDGGTSHREFLSRSQLDWRHQISAVTAFLNSENINGLLSDNGVGGDIGLLSIDIDGMDIWLLEAIEAISPRILIVEYNSMFGPDAVVAVPHDLDFRRELAHYSWLYSGASIAALDQVARRKGYALVGSNIAGNNAFFVRDDVLGEIPRRSPQDAWIRSRFRDSRGRNGELTFIDGHEAQLAAIADMLLWDFERQTHVSVRERFLSY